MTENRFQSTLRQLYPSGEPSTELLEKMATMSQQTDGAAASRVKRQTLLWRSGISVAAAAVAIGVCLTFILTPKMTLARTLHTVYTNLLNAQGSHCRITYSPNGKPTMVGEVWSREGKWRQDSMGNGMHLVQIRADGKFWNYIPAEHRATYQESREKTPMTSIDGEKLQAQMYQMLSDANAKNLGTEMRDGRPLQKIAVYGPVQRFITYRPESGRAIFWIDKSKMLPARAEQQLQEKGNWITIQTVDFDFEQPVSPAVFTIPSDVRTADIRVLGEEAGRPFIRPIAEKQFHSRTIALRDVQVNQEGDIFVLYTDGSTRDTNKESYATVVGDDRGTVYAGTAGGIEPFLYCTDKADNRGMTIGKEAVSGICVTPVSPLVGAWKSRKITVEIHFVEWIKNKCYTRTALFTVPVQHPAAKLLPTYGPTLRMLLLAGGDARQFRLDRESARRAYLFNHQDWPGMIASTNRAIDQGIVDVNTYLERANAYNKLGKRAEAEAELARAREEDKNGFYQAQIAEAEKQLQDRH